MTEVPQWVPAEVDRVFDGVLSRIVGTPYGPGISADARDLIAQALVSAASPRVEDYDQTVEKAAKAIFDAVDPTSGDTIATTLHEGQYIHADTVPEQLAMVMEICREAARAALASVGIQNTITAPEQDQ